MLQRPLILRMFTFNTIRKTSNLICTSKNLFQKRNFSLKSPLNVKTQKEFDDKLFEELYEFKFEINHDEVKKRILQLISKQSSLNKEIFKEKGLRGSFESLGIIKSKRELFINVCEEFNVQLPLGDYDNIQNGLDLCTLICDTCNITS